MQVKDRTLVHKRMYEHVHAADATPLLVFPEGTCVNNEYSVMFKRGAFDLDATICPIAIKYNKIFVDAFWNSRRQPFTVYIVRCCPSHLCRRGPLACLRLLAPRFSAAARPDIAAVAPPSHLCHCSLSASCALRDGVRGSAVQANDIVGARRGCILPAPTDHRAG